MSQAMMTPQVFAIRVL